MHATERRLAGIFVSSAVLLTGCYSYGHSPAGTRSTEPTSESEIVSVAPDSSDSYALSPPPELILPRDEPLAGEFMPPLAVAPVTQPSPTSGDLWVKLRGGFALPRDRLEIRDSARQMAAGRRHLASTLQRGETYLWHMVREVEARGMPIEIALLPAIESAYDPHAYSPSHAVGLWQFLPGTGARFGLRRNWWYDGRRDVTESTRAALDYLAYLHEMFDDWLLALAAYNSGEGRVQQAQQSNRARGLPTDFWSIALPAETRSYVPRLLALTELVAHPERYGYTLPALPDQPRFEVVELPGQVEFELVAGLLKLDSAVLQELNPGFSRWATDPQGPHRLLVPPGLGEPLQQALAVLPADSLVRWQHYVTEDGDDLPSIARRHGVQTSLLQEINRLAGHRLVAGTELRIPRAFSRDAPMTAPAVPVRTAARRSTYTIRPGDSLWRIARQHGVRVNDLARWNNLLPSATLQPGRKLIIRGDDRITGT